MLHQGKLGAKSLKSLREILSPHSRKEVYFVKHPLLGLSESLFLILFSVIEPLYLVRILLASDFQNKFSIVSLKLSE